MRAFPHRFVPAAASRAVRPRPTSASPAMALLARAALLTTVSLAALAASMPRAAAQTTIDNGEVVTIPDADHGTTWNIGGSGLVVGSTTSGTLHIEAGGTVTSPSGSLGGGVGSSGTVTVTGAGSSWNVGANDLRVGDSGTGTLLIAAGGR